MRRESHGKGKVCAKIQEVGIVPAVRTSSAEEARFASDVVAKSGIPIVEITMTVPGAIEVISYLVKKPARCNRRRGNPLRLGYSSPLCGCWCSIPDQSWPGSRDRGVRRKRKPVRDGRCTYTH